MSDASPTDLTPDSCARLKPLLQDMPWERFEQMVPRLVERLIGVRFSQARPGFQEGGDAGTVGRQGRRLRIEAKRYRSDFDARDILGGFHQALRADEALEAWILCATRAVPEQLAKALEHAGREAGVPVIAIDWPESGVPLLAALCTAAPAIVGEFAGPEAGDIAASIEESLRPTLAMLQAELDEWRVGFPALVETTHERLLAMWSSKRAAIARFGQDVAGGDERILIRRDSVMASLDRWWSDCGKDEPAVLLGQGGVGKTWAGLQWMIERLAQLPLVITMPSGALTAAARGTRTELVRLLGAALADTTGTADAEQWARRLGRLFHRPVEEGPALCLLIDGVNQNPDVPWQALCAALQDDPFAGRVRVIVTTRPQFFEGALGRLRRLVAPPVPVTVERFDLAPGGELDTMLERNKVSRGDLHPDLLELARVPRLFGLVLRLRDRLQAADRVTVHRLLWEYGRDVQGERSERSFSETDWREWLAVIAQRERSGLRPATLRDYSDTAARPDLDSAAIAQRLSDIVDGNFMIPGPQGVPQLSPDIVAHALGAALLDWLENTGRPQESSVEADLAEWLDPISGLDERAEVLRAAASIMAQREAGTRPEVAASLVSAWLQTQNLPPQHLEELRRLAPGQVQPLLDAIEKMEEGARTSPRKIAIDALRSIASDDAAAYGVIVATCARWLSRLSRDLSFRGAGHEEAEAARAMRFTDRVGMDRPGPATVLGIAFTVVDRSDDGLEQVVATLLDGRPLAGAVQIFQRAAIAACVRGRFHLWEALKWLCLLNPIDPDETAARLRLAARGLAARTPEPGINAGMPGRIAALLLWMTGIEADEDDAARVDSRFDRGWSYQDDYLRDPGQSFFLLERRHAAAVLADRRLPLYRRCERAVHFIRDPSFDLPEAFVEDVRDFARSFDPMMLDVGRYQTAEDHTFERLEPAMARAAPQDLAALHRRRLAGYATRPRSSFDSAAWSASDAVLLLDDEGRQACESLRTRSMAEGGGINASSPAMLVMMEVLGMAGEQQLEAVIAAELKFIPIEFEDILRPLDAPAVDRLLERDRTGDAFANLICLLASVPSVTLSEQAWSIIQMFALDPASDKRPCAFKLLLDVDAARLGRALIEADWGWATEGLDLCRHYGTQAIAAASAALPLEDVVERLAPWLIPAIARQRGAVPAEVVLVAAILDALLIGPSQDIPPLGADIAVRLPDRQGHPLMLSLTPEPMQGDDNDPLAAFRRAADEEAYARHSERSIRAAVERIELARSSGATLFLFSIDSEDLVPIVQEAPHVVDRWLEGMTEQTHDFARRVRRAEGLFLALCEALLRVRPDTGARLWRALRDYLHTRFLGVGDVPELILQLFRAPDSPIVDALRAEMLALNQARYDADLMNLAVAAIAEGKQDWLARQIASDRTSDRAWRRRRAIVMGGMTSGASLPVSGAHPEGADTSADEEREAEAARERARDACARHWWRAFVAERDPERAYAAWVLFKDTLDRRAYAWFAGEPRLDPACDPLYHHKMVQFSLNARELRKAAEKAGKDHDKELFSKRVSEHVWPWYVAG